MAAARKKSVLDTASLPSPTPNAFLPGRGADAFETYSRKLVQGSDRDDRLTGTAGNDMLVAGAGKNSVSGRGGIDTVVLEGKAGDWAVGYGDHGAMTFSKGGTTTIIDATVERIRFDNMTLDRTSPTHPKVTGIVTAQGTISAGGATLDQTIGITGRADPFARIVIRIDDVVVGTAIADRKGIWSFDHTGTALDGGEHAISAVASLGLSGERTSSRDFDFTVGLVDLGLLPKGPGFVIQGDTAVDYAGCSVSSAGDVNGDGFDDLVIGAFRGSDGADEAGEAYVIFGSDQGFGTKISGRQVVDLSDLTPARGFIIQGESERAFTGGAVSSAGDVNGDGFDDLIVGAVNAGDGVEHPGSAYVIFGSGDGFGTAQSGRQVIDLTTLAARQGFIIRGDADYDDAGISVSSAGDINGDGFDDLIVGAYHGSDGGPYAGEAYVIFGSDQGFGTDASGRRVIDLTTLAPSQGFVIQGDTSGDDAGVSVSTAGDVDGDGFDDIIVGAHYGDDGGARAGEAYVIFGSDQGFGTSVSGRRVIDLTTLTAAQGFIIQGDGASGDAGISVSSAGDVNGDGLDDMIVGARYVGGGGTTAGAAYVIFGSDGGFGTAVSGRKVIDLSTLTAAQGFVIQGAAKYDYAGCAVSSAGDFNGDGLDDIIIGADGNDSGAKNAGAAYVIFGSDDGFGTEVSGRRVVDLSTLTSTQGFIIRGDAKYDSAGRAVSSAGDVNGDGFDDLVVGAPHGSDGGDRAGEAYVIYGGNFGGATTAVETVGTSAAEMFVGGAGDDRLDGRGGADMFRSGAGDDTILVGSDAFLLIRAGTGQDTVSIAGSGITIDARDWSNRALSGIESFDLGGSGDNDLILTASDVFHLSTTGNSAFTAADSHNNVVVLGDAGDSLQLIDYASSGAAWHLAAADRTLAGETGGAFDLYNLVDDDGDVLASVAVDSDVTLVL